jgi:DDE superfamily endonuclease/Helix-turn-helix of DDE superfamily endonuclease
MIARFHRLSRYPVVFKALTGLSLAQFSALETDFAPRFEQAETARLTRPGRRRAIGAGQPFELSRRDQLLLTVVWLRRYPINAVLGYLFGLEETTALRTVQRVLPVLEAAGLDTMRLPDPGKWRRPGLAELTTAVPALTVIIDTFEQAVQRPENRAEADTYYSGKKKRHPLKTQVAIRADTGMVVDLPPSRPGPTADITVLKESGLLARLPADVIPIGDLADVGIDALHPRGATPRRTPRGKPRPPEDRACNTACARRRVPVEHTSGRLRAYQALHQTDRHQRRHHTQRARAIAGLVNRCLAA